MPATIQELYSIFLKHSVICTDSRKIEKDSMFFALKGDNFDGNQYAAQAIADGSAYAIIDNPELVDGEQYLLVDDVLAALQELAMYHREMLSIPVICLTGTNGKTTTKELTAKVLEKKFKVVATKGNFNNHLGVPLSILSIGQDAEIAVIELGANHIGEIAFLCGIAKPTHGLITNIGKAHLEGFGDLEGVKKAKSELYQYLKSGDGTVFINGDNMILKDLAEGIYTVSYGSSDEFYCQGTLINTDKYLKLSFNKTLGDPQEISSKLIGAYNFENILAAVCIGLYFDVSVNDIVEAVENYIPDNSRSQEITTDRNNVIMDAYNANPMNMMAALENFSNQIKENRMVILGDMLELGTYAAEEHKLVIEYIRSQRYDRVMLVGEAFATCSNMLRCEHFNNVSDAKMWLQSSPPSGMNILVKGSRGIGLEALLDAL